MKAFELARVDEIGVPAFLGGTHVAPENETLINKIFFRPRQSDQVSVRGEFLRNIRAAGQFCEITRHQSPFAASGISLPVVLANC
jgi:hypothetical protein